MNTPIKEVTFVSDGVLTPVTRFRVAPILHRLEQRGWKGRSIYGYGEMDHRIGNSLAKKLYRIACRMKRAITTATINPNGPVLLQRLAIPTWSGPEVRLAKRNQKVVFDFDDAIFMNHRHQRCSRRESALGNIFRNSSAVVAGNSWLAQHVPDSAETHVIPTCIDTDKYVPLDVRQEKDSVVIGWMGTSSNYLHLHQLIEPFQKLRETGRDFEFVICSDEPNPELLNGLNARFVKWSAASEVDILRSFDIGLMPLAMTDWCRGKCSFKLIQYMAVGKPVVCTPVGMNLDVVEESKTGYFADEDWASPLDALIQDEALRDRMGSSARTKIVESYSLDVAFNAYQKIFEGLL